MSVPKAKGSSLVLIVKALRAMRPAAAKLLPPELQHYLENRILVASWYPEEDLLGLLRAGASLAPRAGVDPWFMYGRIAASSHASETYKAFYASGDVAWILQHADASWRAQHDTGRLDGTVTGPGQARVSLAGFPLQSRDFCRLLSGYIAGMVEAGGGKNPTVREVRCRCDGEPTCEWEASWHEG
jgi:hypothetical protein